MKFPRRYLTAPAEQDPRFSIPTTSFRFGLTAALLLGLTALLKVQDQAMADRLRHSTVSVVQWPALPYAWVELGVCRYLPCPQSVQAYLGKLDAPLQGILNTQYSWLQGRLACQIRAAVTCCVFKKTLLLSQTELDDFTAGAVQTLMAVDADRVRCAAATAQFHVFLHLVQQAYYEGSSALTSVRSAEAGHTRYSRTVPTLTQPLSYLRCADHVRAAPRPGIFMYLVRICAFWPCRW